MKHFIRTNDRGVLEMCYGKSAKEIAEKFGISTYKFKQQGWEKTDDKDIIRFKFVATGETINNGSIFTGPFDDETFNKVKKESEHSMRDGVMSRRKKNFKVQISDTPEDIYNDSILEITQNGFQWQSIGITETEAVKIMTAIEIWLHKRKNRKDAV